MSLVTEISDFVYVNLQDVKEGKRYIELERLLDPMAYEILGASKKQGLGARLDEMEEFYNRVVGDIGEAFAIAAHRLAGYTNVGKPTVGCWDVSGVSPKGTPRRNEVKTMACEGYGTRFVANLNKAQIATVGNGGAHEHTFFQLERAGRDIAGVLGLLVPTAKLRRLYALSGQAGNEKFVFSYNYAGGAVADYLGATQKRLTFDQVVKDLRNLGR